MVADLDSYSEDGAFNLAMALGHNFKLFALISKDVVAEESAWESMQAKARSIDIAQVVKFKFGEIQHHILWFTRKFWGHRELVRGEEVGGVWDYSAESAVRPLPDDLAGLETFLRRELRNYLYRVVRYLYHRVDDGFMRRMRRQPNY